MDNVNTEQRVQLKHDDQPDQVFSENNNEITKEQCEQGAT